MEDKVNSKGGRVPKKNAEYFPVPAIRPDELKALKLQYGSLGVDVYYTVHEKLCSSDLFVWHYIKPYRLKVFSVENNFEPSEFTAIVEYMVQELELFDSILFDRGYIFSKQFVRQFDEAGLFSQRKIKAQDIYDYAEVLSFPMGNESENENPGNELLF